MNLSELIAVEHAGFLGKKRYERIEEEVNYPDSSYLCGFTLKFIKKDDVRLPRDRKGAFKWHIIPRVNTTRNSFAKVLA